MGAVYGPCASAANRSDVLKVDGYVCQNHLLRSKHDFLPDPFPLVRGHWPVPSVNATFAPSRRHHCVQSTQPVYETTAARIDVRDSETLSYFKIPLGLQLWSDDFRCFGAWAWLAAVACLVRYATTIIEERHPAVHSPHP